LASGKVVSLRLPLMDFIRQCFYASAEVKAGNTSKFMPYKLGTYNEKNNSLPNELNSSILDIEWLWCVKRM
tara:strand:- start:71 stop:283 length:213 start_codon:yes stop_codon:yes gene_type:complete